jgi:hypothetical protein
MENQTNFNHMKIIFFLNKYYAKGKNNQFTKNYLLISHNPTLKKINYKLRRTKQILTNPKEKKSIYKITTYLYLIIQH